MLVESRGFLTLVRVFQDISEHGTENFVPLNVITSLGRNSPFPLYVISFLPRIDYIIYLHRRWYVFINCLIVIPRLIFQLQKFLVKERPD